MEQPIISGIAFNRDEAKLTMLGVPDTPGIAYQILGAIAEANIDVDMIIQNVGHDGTTDFSFTVNRGEFAKAQGILETVKAKLGARQITGDNKICKVSAVGVGMRSHPGVASQMFKALADEGINIQMISTSEIIWMLIPSSASALNIWLATPGWERMPTPTAETLQILLSPVI